VVGFAEGVEGEIVGERAREIATIDSSAQVKTLNDGSNFGISAPVGKEGVEKFALGDVVLRKSCSGGKDMHAGLGIGNGRRRGGTQVGMRRCGRRTDTTV